MKENNEQLQQSTARLDLSKKTSPPLTPGKRTNYTNIEVTAQQTQREERQTYGRREIQIIATFIIYRKLIFFF